MFDAEAPYKSMPFARAAMQYPSLQHTSALFAGGMRASTPPAPLTHTASNPYKNLISSYQHTASNFDALPRHMQQQHTASNFDALARHLQQQPHTASNVPLPLYASSPATAAKTSSFYYPY